MTIGKWKMKNGKCGGLPWLCLVFLFVNTQVLAQTATPKADSDPLHQLNNSVKALVRRVTPSVVQVLVTGYGPVEDSHGDTNLVLGKQQSLGSGVIIDPDGYIVTNAHVLRGAHRVQVKLPAAASDETPDGSLGGRGRTVEAHIVGSDSGLDLALLKIETKGLSALPLGDYNKVRQGEVVFAFGSPEGLQDSVTMGVVSAASRQRDADSPMVYVQTDAPINPGNSGGPLVNVDGELVGINTFILSRSAVSQGLGFAIPSTLVASTYSQLRKNGHLQHDDIGVRVQGVTPALASGLGLPRDWGVIVADVLE